MLSSIFEMLTSIFAMLISIFGADCVPLNIFEPTIIWLYPSDIGHAKFHMDFADISAARKLVDDRDAFLKAFLERFAEELVPIQGASFAGKVDYIYGEKIRYNGANYQLREGLIDASWRNVLLDLQCEFATDI